MFKIAQPLTDRIRIKLFQHPAPLDVSCHFFVFAHNLSVSSDAASPLLIRSAKQPVSLIIGFILSFHSVFCKGGVNFACCCPPLFYYHCTERRLFMKRIRYFDLLRCISFCFIIFYHMISQLYFSRLFPLDKVLPFYENDNMNIAMLGVAVFFILSGAGLAYSTGENFDIRRFYKKRFIRILIPFYITYISYFIYKAGTTGSFTSFFPPETSAWKIIFTFFGMDEWISQHGIHTFSLGIGEWFLGALIILYLLFPLLRFLMKKNPCLFFIGSTCIYLLLLFYYPFILRCM